MSHHFTSLTSIEDGRLNLLDVYVFPEAPGTSTLVLTVNPDSGRSSPATFRADAVYEFVIASDGGTGEDRAFRMTFDAPDADGNQKMRVRYAVGRLGWPGPEGTELGVGRTGEAFALGHSGSAWFGLAGDPFWGDAPALFAFTQALAKNQYRPELFTATPANLQAGRNVTAIALQVPDVTFGGTDVAVWARISLSGPGPARQVSRAANPMVPSLFFQRRGADTEAFNAGSPAGDVAAFGAFVRRTAARVAELSRACDPAEHAATVVAAFLPDLLRYRPGQPARFAPGTGNGRGLHDDAFGTALSLLVGKPLGVTSSPNPLVPGFPHLAPPRHGDLPALADLLGLRARAYTKGDDDAPPIGLPEGGQPRPRTREGHGGRLDLGHPGLRGRRQADLHLRWHDNLRRPGRVDPGRMVDRGGRGVLVLLAA